MVKPARWPRTRCLRCPMVHGAAPGSLSDIAAPVVGPRATKGMTPAGPAT